MSVRVGERGEQSASERLGAAQRVKRSVAEREAHLLVGRRKLCELSLRVGLDKGAEQSVPAVSRVCGTSAELVGMRWPVEEAERRRP